MAIVAPWIQAPDIAGQYSRGLGLGVQIAQEQQRLSAENARTTMEAQARQETNLRQTELERARIATEQAYRTIQTNLAQERLAQVQRAFDARTRQAALIARDQSLFNQDIASGMDVPTAMARHPLARAQQAITRESEQARLKQTGQHQAVTERQGQERLDVEKAAQDIRRRAANRPVATGQITESFYDVNDPTKKVKQVTRKTFSTPVAGAGVAPMLQTGAAPAAQPFPKSKADAKVGVLYQTKDGDRVWNGQHFVLPQEQSAAAAGTPPDTDEE